MSDALPLHGGQLRRIAERYNVPLARLIDFSANINPDGPPAALLAALRAGIDDMRTLREYPDAEMPGLRTAIAAYAGVAAENVIVGNGFVPLLETALRVLGVRRCVLPVPCFLEYRRTLESAGVEVIAQQMRETTGFSLDEEWMPAAGADAMLLANPQNPSGALMDRSQVRALVQQAERHGLKVLLDEAFIDYEPDHSLARDVEQFPNLIVFRSVTKFFGVPGLRVAYAVAAAEVAKDLENAGAPWPVTTLAALAVAAGLGDRDFRAFIEGAQWRPASRACAGAGGGRHAQLSTGSKLPADPTCFEDEHERSYWPPGRAARDRGS